MLEYKRDLNRSLKVWKLQQSQHLFICSLYRGLNA